MVHRTTLFALVVGIAMQFGCSNDESGFEVLDPAMANVPGADISGPWEWSRSEHLTLPAWVAAIVVGIQPEGPVTQAHCESQGTMTLFQAGASFFGFATQTFISCETRGGQQFQPLDWTLPIAVEDGRISGASLRFSFNTATPAPCPHHAQIREAEAGFATELRGGGQCYIPGHPRSESPIVLPPPPAGTSKTLRWEAIRP